MKASIIEFSPLGNTNHVSELIKAALEQNNISVQLVNITGNEKYFSTNNKRNFLQETIGEHDILFIGSPSYFVYIKKVDDKSYKYKNFYIINERNIINIK
ncbi:hypothetical protein [Clostridium autoethanogenum]|uniref:hypothetical protein n=1 Tax=Clostridium autoethanogenum TaxID=84023 RepID=UPI001604D565|nr:hypothetical protein [Clostridium autoethanogenum]